MKKISAFVTILSLLFGIMTTAEAFTHPGVALTVSDLDTINANLNQQPWASGFAALQADGHSSLSYTMQGPFTYVDRNYNGLYTNESAWENDMDAVWNLALMWYFTGNSAYAQKSHDILLKWATTQTAYNGIEASFDLGDYALNYAGAADILRGTWSGWTATDTTNVQHYFKNVFEPDLGVPGLAASGSQGMEALKAAISIAVFDDDTTYFNSVISTLLTDADSGFRDTYPNGEVGDTGRDQGHAGLFVNDLAFCAEVAWKQGVDIYSIMDNRVLATSEYYARTNLGGTLPAFSPLGAPFWGPFYNIGGSPPWYPGEDRMTSNIIHGAYAVRRGLGSPWSDLYNCGSTEDGTSFVFLKRGDPSTATPAMVPTLPATSTVTTGLTSADINGVTPAGSGAYSAGAWTLVSGDPGANDPWSVMNPSVHWNYKAVTGNFTMIAKVNSVSANGSAHNKAGILLMDTTGTANDLAWIAITSINTYERVMQGWSDLPYGSNAAQLAFSVPGVPYWVKMEKVGNIIQTFVSQDGGCWSPAGSAGYTSLPSTMYVGLFGCSEVSGSTSTAQFSNVVLTGGDGGAGPTVPAAPYTAFVSADDGRVYVRWTPAFGATGYKVYRSSNSGGYAQIASVSNNSYTDTGLSDGTTYSYAVAASNPAGTSGYSLADSGTPISSMVNVAFGGTANSSSGTGGANPAYQAFDQNGGTKWYSGSNSGLPAWISYDLGSGITQTIKRYAVTSGWDVPARDPASWLFQGSNDNTNWTTLDSQSGQSFALRQQVNYYNISNGVAYRYYRLFIESTAGEDDTQIGELSLYANSGHLIPNGTYSLSNRNSHKELAVSGGGTSNGAPIVQWGYDGGSEQQWTFTDMGNGRYQAIGVGSGRALDLPGSSKNQGTQLDIRSWRGGPNQLWTLTPVGDGYFHLNSVNSGLVIDVSGGSTANGTSVIQWANNGGLNQHWMPSLSPKTTMKSN